MSLHGRDRILKLNTAEKGVHRLYKCSEIMLRINDLSAKGGSRKPIWVGPISRPKGGI